MRQRDSGALRRAHRASSQQCGRSRRQILIPLIDIIRLSEFRNNLIISHLSSNFNALNILSVSKERKNKGQYCIDDFLHTE